MAEIGHRRNGEFVRKAFEILLAQPDGLPAKTVLERIEQSIQLTEFEKSTYPGRPSDRRFEKIVRFATIAHVKAGWLLKTKGQWIVTEQGRQAYQQFQDPEMFHREAHRLYKQWAATQPQLPTEIAIELEDALDATGTFEQAEEVAWREIQQHLQRMNPFDFQNLVASLLRAMGYHVFWNSPPGADGGFDVLAYTDPLGVNPPRIKVQVKRRADRINVEGLRSFLALLSDHDAGIFVATGGFTSDAEAEARREKRRITLLKLEQLFDLWVAHYQKIPEQDKQWLPLKPIYYLAPRE